jgi:hypothetical protein
MRKLVMVAAATAAFVIFGSSTQQVSAQTWRGAQTISTVTENATWIERAACNRDERCVKGRHWRSGKCVPCPR